MNSSIIGELVSGVIMVCPAYGLDGMAIYKLTKDYSAPEY